MCELLHPLALSINYVAEPSMQKYVSFRLTWWIIIRQTAFLYAHGVMLAPYYNHGTMDAARCVSIT